MTRRTRPLAALVVATLSSVLALSACGGDDGDPASQSARLDALDDRIAELEAQVAELRGEAEDQGSE